MHHHFFSNGFEYGGFPSESVDFPEILSAELRMDQDEECDELGAELVELNASLSRIDSRLDFSRIIDPLLVQLDVPPSQPLCARTQSNRFENSV